jgi:sugar lactone lactonase YvrE
MAALLVLSVGGVSLADGTEDAGLLPPEVDSLQAFESMPGSGHVGAIEADTNPAAAETMPHTDLDRAEAGELLEEVFGNELEAPGEFFDDLEVDAFRSDHVALVAPPVPGAGAGLLTSTLPLRTENDSGDKELIDLDLEAEGGELQPQNSLVEVAIPTDLSDGISMPEAGVSIHLASGDVERQASEIGDSSAFYPNVREETDVVVTATPTGVETYTHLRSPDAPRQETFDLDLPQGSSLTRTPSGGAEVTSADGTPILTVQAPWAIDAEGTQVPAALDVEGHSVTVSVAPAADAAYPILVDPLWEGYDLTNGSQAKEWTGANNQGFGWDRGGYGGSGLNVYAFGGAMTSPGSQGSFNYYVPRYWSDQQLAGSPKPQSFIRAMNIWGLTFAQPDEMGIPEQNRPAYPFMQLELRDEVKNEFVWQYARMGNQGTFSDPGYVFNMTNPNENTGVKHGGFAMATFASSNSNFRFVNVKHASVELSDKDLPSWAYMPNPSGWMDKTRKALPFGVGDAGLGIYSYRLTQPSAKGGSEVFWGSENCWGTVAVPCPRDVESTGVEFPYNPSTMAQGENVASVVAFDPVSNQSAPKLVKLKVDHSAPAISLSGSLTEQGTVGTGLPEYALNYTASDGDDAAAAAQAAYGTQGTGAGQLERPQGAAVDAEGNTWVTDRIRTKIVAYDKTGKLLREFGVKGSADGQINEPRGIAIGSNGNVWVADWGNKRIQQFTPTGTFVSKVTRSDFVEPWGVAVGANGVVWVTDQGSKKVFQFKEDGTFLRSKEVDKAPAKYGSPFGVDVDAYGNGWIAIQSAHKVLELSPTLEVIQAFGSEGTGTGQFRFPTDIAIADSGNLFVSDDLNGRVQEFKPEGSFLRQMGSVGAGLGQLSGPRGIDTGPGNQLVVADADNHRVARWSHADQDPQSGTAKVEVKVDGTSVKSTAPGCTTKNCSVSGSWTLDADDYAGGAHKVEVIATDAVGISQTKTIDIETHGDHTDPAIALSGTMTQQASNGTTRPSYKLKAVATDPGPTAELKSGVASTVIKVDGAVVDSSSPGCPAGGCSITREWTLNSDSYSVGSHTVEVKATDAAGRVSTKTLSIDIARDTTAPEVSYFGPFYSAPSGWLEQKQVGYTAFATDYDGYGVTSVELKIDGAVVNSTSQTCPAGACLKVFASGQTLDMAQYSGGAHPAEFIAKDGAGNVRKRSWTINVDPEGHISATEATETLEAIEVTAPETVEASPVNGLVTEEVGEEGSSPKLIPEGEGFASEGTAAPSVVSLDPEDGFTVTTAAVDKEEVAQEETIEVRPVSISGTASNAQLTDGSAAVIANSAAGVDTVLRPAYDGLMAFQDIRTPSSSKTFSWEVLHLGEGETLQLIDERHAGVFWDDGTQAMLISATAAHDADGKEVQTTLAVSEGNIVTLTVHHDVAGVIYPVVAGVGYQGGFQQIAAEGPPPTEQAPEGEEAGASYSGYVVNEWLISAPEPATPADAEVNASGWSLAKRNSLEHRRFRFIGCHYMEDVLPPYSNSATVERCGNPFANNSGPHGVAFNYAIRGSYFRLPGEFSKHAGGQKDHIDCDKMLDKSHYGDAAAEFKYFITETRCEWYGKTKDGEPVYAPLGKHITPYGEWNWGRSYSWDGPWDHFGPVGLALYIWATKSRHIGRHETTCVDCS